ncbi:hypothetical protein ACIQU5_34870 [Streptomyces sp. NPDC090306]|uniref:hypothetical protein n=1 Tax=Streptomyces sp. NPDC090306 TaxID=3365961 RepID=UPI0038116E7C
MSARHRLPKPDGDGRFAGIVLLTANLLGLGFIGVSQIPHSASTAVALDLPLAEDTPDAGPVSVKKDSGPAHAASSPRAAKPARYSAGGTTVPSRPESDGTVRDGTAPVAEPARRSVNVRGISASDAA